MADLEKATGVDLGVVKAWTLAGSSPQTLAPVPNIHRVPVIGLASAGAPVADEQDERIIGWEYPAADEYRPHMLCLQVDGESMDNGEADGLRDGDRLYVDTRDLTLQEGKVYVVHVHGNGIVVKRARQLGNDWWLFSDNANFSPTRPDEATIIGRVYFHQPRGKRL
ncbi:S24 family peptidase [Deinococcus geothermalis]|uniref:S24 family peptidase n=1 Tax=Deinococcus geothermalis TaxID=68909 RepID=UPI001E609BE9